MKIRPANCLVLLSGGQDSTTCLYWAKAKFKSVNVLNIMYGQRHEVECMAARKIASMADINSYQEFNLDFISKLGNSFLVGEGNISDPHPSSNKLPGSFVPGRNIFFLSVAAAIAYKKRMHDIVIGVSQTDYSGYPDCRASTITSIQTTLSLAMDYRFVIHTPLMYLSKDQTVKMATTLPGCIDILAYSHTCYEGEVPPCGKCPACILRAKGFKEEGITDPLLERLAYEKLEHNNE